MGGWKENTIVQLRRIPVEELLKKREAYTRLLDLLKWAIRLYCLALVVAVVLFASFGNDRGSLSILLAVAAILLVAQRDRVTRLWFIDLVLAEREQE